MRQVQFIAQGTAVPKNVMLTVPKFGTLGDLRAKLAESEAVDKDRLVMTEIYWNDLYTMRARMCIHTSMRARSCTWMCTHAHMHACMHGRM